jgi:putative ABC transport system permease protein
VRDWQAFVRSHLKLLGLRPEREARIVRELAAQLEDFYRDALTHGSSEAEADAHACAQVHDWERMAQDVWLADRPHAQPALERLTHAVENHPHLERGVVKMSSNALRDMRYAVRQLVATPAFTIVAILTLALGIGATTAIFSVVNGVLLRPLPYPHPENLVIVYEIIPQYGRFSVAPANFLDWRRQNTVFERIAAYNGGSATFTEGGSAERITSASVSWDLFELLQVSPALGRGFRQEEDAPGKNNVIVLSYGMWQRRFGSDPNVLGRSVTLSGVPVTIVGVMPQGFYFASRTTEFWQPVALNPANASRGGHFLAVIARTKPGVSTDRAGAEMKAIAERLAKEYPKNSANESAGIALLREQVVGRIRPALLTLLAAVGVVILIACANVANLLLVRASLRGKEIAIRAALGAGRKRLALQMLTESLILSIAGGALGLLIAYLVMTPIKKLGAGSIPRVDDVSIDLLVLLFALLISLSTGLLFGLAPAWHALRAGLGEILKEGGRSSSASGGRWVRGGLLVVEVALSIILLVGAALLLRSFSRLTHVDPGFRANNVLAFRVALPNASYPQDYNRIAFFDRLLADLDALPEVTAAGAVQNMPLRGDYMLSFAVQGRPQAKPGEEPSANYRSASPDYFRALGIPLLRGRGFTPQDTEKSKMVALVDDAFVRRHFPDEDPIGHGLDIGNGTDGFYEIVGVVGNVRYNGLDEKATPTMYVSARQQVFSAMWVVVQTSGDPASVAASARQVLRNIDQSLPAFLMSPVADVVYDSVAQQRFSMLLLGIFAGIAVFLAAVGLYGVVAYSVSQRTQEIGVRIAMGAQRGQVLGLVVGGGMKLAAVGVVIGVGGALLLSRFIETMLFEITPLDTVSYVVTSAILLLVAAVACYVPAQRASRVDPIVALRQA